MHHLAPGVLDARDQVFVRPVALGRILWEEGGVICPMFNDFIDGVSESVAGWVDDPNLELMNGFASAKTWFA